MKVWDGTQLGLVGPRSRMRRAGEAVAVAAVAGTALVVASPSVRFAYLSHHGHIAIEVAVSIVALIGAALVAGRARRDGALHDLLLMGALWVAALGNFGYSALPAIIQDAPGSFATWAPMSTRLLVASGFLAAAFAPDRRIACASRAVVRTLAGGALAVAAIGLGMAELAPHLPAAVDPGLSPTASDRPVLAGNWLVVAVQLVLLGLYGAATVGFARRHRRTGDPLLGAAALAALLAALARVHYTLYPSLYSNWLYTGDLLRLASWITLLVGVLNEIARYQRRLADDAVYEERRRMARDLHDGLAQELAFIRSQSAGLASGGASPERLQRITGAAQRALDESRSAIAALSRPLDQPFEVMLRETAEEAAQWGDAEVELDLDHGFSSVSVPATRETLLRIAREAVGNAVRHGDARRVRILGRRGGGLRLCIEDDGAGFDPGAAARTGSFGLTSMRERAEALGGRLELRSAPGRGTQVEVVLP